MSTEAVNPSPANPEYTKVFIGNLAFVTREEALTKAFADINIELHSVNVVVKRGRSMGYGFVEIDEKDLPTALEKLHKSQLDERTINLEKATSTNSNKQTRKPRKPRNKKRNPKPADNAENSDKAPATEKSAPPAREKPAGAPAKPRKPRVNRNKKPAGNNKPKEGQATVVESGSGAPAGKEAPKAPPASTVRKPKTRKPKPAASTQKREHSNTELYVANIPFSLTDEELQQEFSQFGCVSATVIINSYGKNKGKSNRGYGFVKVDTEANQQAAIEQDKKLKIGGRDISIKPAFVRTEPVAKPAQESAGDAPKEAPKAEEAKKE